MLLSLIQVTNGNLVLDHALVMLLLLVGLLSMREGLRSYVPAVILAGVALSLFTPFHVLGLAWPILSALILPPLLWQLAVRMASARPALMIKAWLAWLLTALLIGLALALGGRIPVTSALLLGILAASLVWQVRERVTGRTDLGAFGQLALALVLVEVDISLHPLGPLLGSLFSGAVLGLVLGFVGVRIALRFAQGWVRDLVCLGLAYVAYLLGTLMGGSGVVTAAMAGLTVAVYGLSAGLWGTLADLPIPLSHTGVFGLMAAAFLLLGWQAHVPLRLFHVAGISLSMVAVAISVLVTRRLIPVSLEDEIQTRGTGEPAPRLTLPRALWLKERKVVLLLLGTLLLWPREANLPASLLTVALLAALVTLAILRIMLYPVFSLLGIELQSPEDSE